MGCVSGDKKLAKENTSICIIRVDSIFAMMDRDAMQPYLNKLELLKKYDNNGSNALGILSTTGLW